MKITNMQNSNKSLRIYLYLWLVGLARLKGMTKTLQVIYKLTAGHMFHMPALQHSFSLL